MKGHGTYTEVADQKQWFAVCKESERVICHFYRPQTKWCQYIDKHFQALAPKHMEAKFIKINAEKCPFLVQRLNIVLMPTVIMTKVAKPMQLSVRNSIPGLRAAFRLCSPYLIILNTAQGLPHARPDRGLRPAWRHAPL